VVLALITDEYDALDTECTRPLEQLVSLRGRYQGRFIDKPELRAVA